MATGRTIRVLLVEDHLPIREGLRRFLESYPDIDVVGEAGNGEEAVVSVATLQPAVVVMDVSMPKKDGIATTRQIKSQHPQVAVVGLTLAASGHLSDSMKTAGACEVLTKGEDAVDGLYQAIKKAAFPVQAPAATTEAGKADFLVCSTPNP